MRNGVELVEILDEYLKEKDISRRQFCMQVDIPTSTVASWKSKNILPNTELLGKIASFMNVSIDWLISDSTAFGNSTSSPAKTFERIEIILRQNNNEYQIDTKTLQEKYLNGIVDYELLLNWSKGRANISSDVLPKIAERLGVSIDWLLTGKEETDQVIDTHLYKLAKEHEGVLKGFDCLDEEKQKAISKEIADSLELRRLQREAKLKK